MAHIPQKSKNDFAKHLKEIWLAPDIETAKKRADSLCEQYEKRYPSAINILENGLEESLTFYSFPQLDSRKISSSNMIERLNREIRRRTKVVGIFPNPQSYCRLVTTYLMDYSEEWSAGRSYMNPEAIQAIQPTAA